MRVRYMTVYETDRNGNRIEIYKNSKISSLEVLRELNERQKGLASYILFREFNEIIPRGVTELSEIFSSLESSDKENITEELVRVVKEGTIDDKHWEWIKNSERTKLWFWNYFKYNRIIAGTKNIPSHQQASNDYFENTILDIYSYFESDTHIPNPYVMHRYKKIGERSIELYKNDKLTYMIKIREFYAAYRTNDRYFEWLNIKDNSQLVWAQNYLEKCGILLKPDGFISNSPTMKIAQIEASIDSIGNFEPLDSSSNTPPTRLLFINKMRRAWSQKNFREAGKVKSKYHLPLTKQTRKRLEKIAKVYGESDTATLELLINSAYETDFIDEQGKDLY